MIVVRDYESLLMSKPDDRDCRKYCDWEILELFWSRERQRNSNDHGAQHSRLSGRIVISSTVSIAVDPYGFTGDLKKPETA